MPRAFESWLTASSVDEATNGEGFFDRTTSSNNTDVNLILKSKQLYDSKGLIAEESGSAQFTIVSDDGAKSLYTMLYQDYKLDAWQTWTIFSVIAAANCDEGYWYTMRGGSVGKAETGAGFPANSRESLFPGIPIPTLGGATT